MKNSLLQHVSSRGFNQHSVKEALKSIQMKLKLFKDVPPNGLAIFNGTFEASEGKSVKINYAFEPPKPLNRALYLCDDKFHTKHLHEMLQDHSKYGVIIVDGKGATWYQICGNTRDCLYKLDVDLPGKHGRGGQSANRFARQRDEKRDWYLKRVIEISERVFIGSNNLVDLEGIILAGCADFKNDLFASQFLDQRLKAKVLKVVDVQYGGDAGLYEVLLHCDELMKSQKLFKEREVLIKYMTLIADDGACAYGIVDTLFALEAGAVETLIVSEELREKRYELLLKTDNGEEVKDVVFKQEEVGANSKVVDTSDLLEWLMENYQSLGASKIQLVSVDTQQGNQFLRAFEGLGAVLRYKLPLPSQSTPDDDDLGADLEEDPESIV